MPEPKEHEVYIWPLKELLEFNDELKKRTDTDLVALFQSAQAGFRAVIQIRILGVLGKAYIKVVRDTEYIIFKGPPGLRPNLAGTRYLRANPKVAMFVVGTREIIKDAAEGFKVAVIAYVAIDVVQEILQDHFSLARLGVKVASDISQALISAGVGVLAGVVATTVGAPVVVAFVIVVAAGMAVGMLLNHLDQKYGLTDKAVARMMELEDQAKAHILDYKERIGDEIERGIDRALSGAARSATNYAEEKLQKMIEDLLFDNFYPYRLR